MNYRLLSMVISAWLSLSHGFAFGNPFGLERTLCSPAQAALPRIPAWILAQEAGWHRSRNDRTRLTNRL
jgi:hypothetical protein